jgi:HlyD family secretion protein
MYSKASRILCDWRWLTAFALGIGAGGFAVHGKVAADRTVNSMQTGSISNQKKPAAITVTTVERREIRHLLDVTGSLVARDEILVGAQIDNVRVEEYLVDIGDKVEEGQVLARLDRSVLETRLGQNASEIARAEATIRQTAAAIAELEATYAEVLQAAERARKLNLTGVVSSETLQSRETSLQVTEARLTGQRENLAFAVASRDFVVAQRQEIRLNLSRANVLAPAAGIVSTRNASVGQLVATSGDPLFRIIRNEAIELEADVVEDRLDALAVGQKVSLTMPGHQPKTGNVRLVAPSIDPVTRLGTVRISLEADPALRPGRFVTATVEIRSQNSLVVPLSAILFGEEGPRVQVAVDGQVESRVVSIGIRDADGIAILAGLRQGEIVVTKAGGFLRDGDRITPVSTWKSEAVGRPVSRTRIN